MREVRIRMIHDRFDGKAWSYVEQPVVLLGDVGKWSMVRRADSPQAMPFVISRKERDRLALRPHLQSRQP